MTRTRDGYRLSSGREFSANRGLVSIVEDASQPLGFSIGEGYDGAVVMDDSAWNDDSDPWTAEERAELADYMMAIWEQFKRARSRGER